MDYFDDEIAMRKRFSYPPYSIFLKITVTGDKIKIKQDMETVKTSLALQDFLILPYFIGRGGKYSLSGIARIMKDNWPDKNIQKKLIGLPPKFRIEINPENLI